MSSLLERKRRALIMGSGGWWLPPNFVPDDCICAYQFKGAGDEASALSDLTGHGYTLTKYYGVPENVVWNNDTGFYLGGAPGIATWRIAHALHNGSVPTNQIKSVIVKFQTAGGLVEQIAYSIPHEGDEGLTFAFHTGWYDDNEGRDYSIFTHQASNSIPTISSNFRVVGHNLGWGHGGGAAESYRVDQYSEIYLNGVRVQIDSKFNSDGRRSFEGVLFGATGAPGNVGSLVVVGGAFYKRWLTASEMSHIYDQINAI